MAYSHIASLVEGLGSGGGTSSALNTSGADIIFVGVSSYQANAQPTLTDSKSNTWTALTASEYSGLVRTRIYYCVGPTVGSGHTFALSGAASYSGVGVAAFSGGKQTSPFDVEAGANNASTSHQSGSVTPSEDNEIVIASVSTEISSGSWSPNGGFTLVGAVNFSGGAYWGLGLAYLIQTSAAAANPTWSGWSGSLAMAGTNATFKAAAGGGGGSIRVKTHHYKQMMGAN